MKVRSKHVTLILAAALVLAPICSALAQGVPNAVGYQGKLTNSSGQPVPDGSYQIQFKLFTVASGGAPFWTSAVQSVTTSGGVFMTQLQPLGALDLAGKTDVWLETLVGGAALTARVKLASTPFALRAGDIADGVVTSAKIADGTIQPADLGFWTGDITSVIAGSGLSGGGTSGDVTLNVTAPLDLSATTVGVPFVPTVKAVNYGNNAAIEARSRSGDAAWFHIDDADTYGNALYVQSVGLGAGVYANVQAGAVGIRAKTIGTEEAGVFEISNTGSTNSALRAQTTGSGPAFRAIAGTGLAGDFQGTVQMRGINLPTGAAAGKVLTSDASGVGTWQAPGLSGLGGPGYITRWGANQSLENADMYQWDDGDVQIYGDQLYVYNAVSGLTPGIPMVVVGNQYGSAGLLMGKDSQNSVSLAWVDSPLHRAQLSTYGLKPLILQDSGGNVGIGDFYLKSPAAKLDVEGTAQMTGFKLPTGAAAGKVLTSDASGVGTWQTPSGGGGIGGSGTDNYLSRWDGTGALENSSIYQTDSGIVGIGTTDPQATLTVNSSIPGVTLAVPSIMLGNPTGNCAFRLGKDVDNQGGLAWVDGHGGYLSLSTYASKPLILQENSGNVGIGTVAPAAALDVIGTVQAGALRLPSGARAGKVLTSDASGVGTWQDATGMSLPYSGSVATAVDQSAFSVTNTGSGIAGYFESSTYYGVHGVSGSSDYPGVAGMNWSGGDGVWGFTSAYGSRAGVFDAQNETNPEPAVEVRTFGAGPAIRANVAMSPGGAGGTGIAGIFGINNTSNPLPAILAATNGSGPAIMATPGTGLAGHFQGTVQMNGFLLPTGAAAGRVLTSDASGNGTWQAATGGLTLPYSGSTSSGGSAFTVTNTGGGPAARFDGGRVEVTADLRTPITYDYNDMSYYLDPNGFSRMNSLSLFGLQLSTGAANGWVLTSDAFGNASWQAPSGGGIGGSGTYGYMPLWTGSTSLGNSMIFQSGSNVGIGTSGPWEKLQVDSGNILVRGASNFYPGTDAKLSLGDGNHYVRAVWGAGLRFGALGYDTVALTEGGYVGIGTVSPAYTLDVNGYIQGWNVYPSDARWKTNVQTIPNALDSLLKLRGVSFEWNPEPERNFPDGQHLGLIAQEVEKVLPEVVTTDGRGYRSVAYQEIVPVLVEAVKEQQKTIDDQQKQIDELKRLVAELCSGR